MNLNLKILDRYDHRVNIYKLVIQLAERAHAITNGAPVQVEISQAELGSCQLVEMEFLAKGESLRLIGGEKADSVTRADQQENQTPDSGNH